MRDHGRVNLRPAAVLLAATLLAGGCAAQVPGTDAARARRSPTTTSHTEVVVTPSTPGELPVPSVPETSPSPSSAAPPKRVSRKGVSLTPPRGYDDVTRQITVPNLLMAFRGQTDGTHYVLVQVTATEVEDLATTVQQVQRDVTEQVEAPEGGEWVPISVGRVRSETFGGVRAYGFSVIGELAGVRSVRMQWYVARRGALYVVTSTSPSAQSKASDRALTTLLRSWRWG